MLAGSRRLDLRRQPQRLRVQAGVALGLAAERVEVGREVPVAAYAGDVDRGRVDGVQQLPLGYRRAGARRLRRGRGGCRGGRLGRGTQLHAERREHLLVEAVLAAEQFLDQPEEASRLGPLDDAVVVGGGHRDDLLRPDHLADLLQSHRVADRAAGDDRALPRHQPGDGGHRAEAAGVGERDVGAHQVVGSQAVGAGFLDQGVVGLDEAIERQPPRVEDHRHHQRPCPVGLLDVHGDTEVHVLVAHAGGACSRPRRSGRA